jgi:hypothetical protein
MRHTSNKQKAALKHSLTRARHILPDPAASNAERLLSGLGIFVIGAFFGWLLAGCPF